MDRAKSIRSKSTKVVTSLIYKSHIYSFMSPFTLYYLTIFALVKVIPEFICPLLSCVFIVSKSSHFILRNQLENRLLGKKIRRHKLVKEREAFNFNISHLVSPCKKRGIQTRWIPSPATSPLVTLPIHHSQN